MVNVESLTPMLRTWDLSGTIEFYTRVLGFECKAQEPELGWASLSLGPVSLMLSGPNEHEGDVEPAFTGSLYFRVRDVEDLWSRLKDRARVCYPIETFGWGMREFAIYDNNGYLLQFGQDVGGAVEGPSS
jgi:uncharacterized glyoxalase superfamily protein PhnB